MIEICGITPDALVFLKKISPYIASDEDDALDYVRTLLSFLPSNNAEPSQHFESKVDLQINQHDLEIDTLVPDSPNQPYDMHVLVKHVLDDDEFFEIHGGWAQFPHFVLQCDQSQP